MAELDHNAILVQREMCVGLLIRSHKKRTKGVGKGRFLLVVGYRLKLGKSIYFKGKYRYIGMVRQILTNTSAAH